MKADRAQPGNTDRYIAGFYGSTDRLVAALEKELVPYEVSKGTIRFPLGDPVLGEVNRADCEVPGDGGRREA